MSSYTFAQLTDSQNQDWKSLTRGSTTVYLGSTAPTLAGGKESIWGTTISNITSGGIGTSYELGTKFQSSAAGKISAIRVYSAANESGNHTARIWRNSDNTVVGVPYTMNFGGTAGWVTYTLPTSVEITAGTEYTVTVSTGTDTNKVQVAIAAPNAGNNGKSLSYPANGGVYTRTLGTRPTSSLGNNYLRDVVFEPYETIWGASVANITSGGIGTAYELGTKFQASKNGRISAVRVYSSANESGNHTARIWRNSDNTVVGGPYTMNFGGTAGWVTYSLPTSIDISADTEYTVSVTTGTDTNKEQVAVWVPNVGNNGKSLSYPANGGCTAPLWARDQPPVLEIIT